MGIINEHFEIPGKDFPPQEFMELKTQQGQINWLAQFLMSVNNVFDNVSGTVTTLEPDASAYVEIEFDDENNSATFDFYVPQGQTGAPGHLESLTATATTLAAGQSATATVVFDEATQSGAFTFGIPTTNPTDAQVSSAVDSWLTAHPEATTTVQDNSITNAKLVQNGGVLTNVNGINQALFEDLDITWQSGGHIDYKGDVSANNVYSHSDYFDCSKYIGVTLTLDFLYNNGGIAFYDFSKTCIKVENYSTSLYSVNNEVTFKVPYNAKFCRASILTAHEQTSPYNIIKGLLSNVENSAIKRAFGISLTSDDITALGYTTFIDIPYGSYLVYLPVQGSFGFPSKLGQTFYLDVSNQRSTGYAFKTFKAFASSGYACYCMCLSTTSSSNLPVWHDLSKSAWYQDEIPLFDSALSSVNLLLLGDSITQGAGASGLQSSESFTTSLGTKPIFDEGNSWALKLESYLADEYPNITLTNHGWGGITIEQLATYISEFVPANTTHCILGLGINSEGATSFDSPIATIVNYLLARNIKVFAWTSWLGTHPNRQNINTAGRVNAALIHAYNNAGIKPLPVYSIALKYIEDNNIDFDDVMEWQADNEIVHPNDLGHDILYRIIRAGFGF